MVKVELFRAIFWGILTRSGCLSNPQSNQPGAFSPPDRLTKSLLSSITLASVQAERTKTKISTFARQMRVPESEEYVDVIMLSGSVWLISGDGG